MAEQLARLDLRSVQDLLFHLPFRYEDRTRLVPIASLRPGMQALVAGTIASAKEGGGRRKAWLIEVRADDASRRALYARFFHCPEPRRQQLRAGARVRLFGEVRLGPSGLEMMHPECVVLAPDDVPVPEPTLTPVYRLTEGLAQFRLRRVMAQVLQTWLPKVPELLPESVRALLDLMPIEVALGFVHAPPPDADLMALEEGGHPAQRRLAFEELLAWQLGISAMKRDRVRAAAHSIAPVGALVERFRGALPFSLTRAQERTLGEIRLDLAKPHPMQRLLQGDVGSGKTAVACAAALLAIESGFQVAVMAPTELLAAQHARNFTQWLAPLGIEVAALSGGMPAGPRRDALAAISSGEAKVAVGTHALFSEAVAFHSLGFVIVDEQHRFGVAQRLRLLEKSEGNAPHQLILSATPIPRTLAQSLYADLDISVIDELPPGRTPVATVTVAAARRQEVFDRVRKACGDGRQAYWVCPLIEENEEAALEAAEATAKTLAEAAPELSIGLLHGRMRPAIKEKTMAAFREGRIKVLVATTVIEVGVDVPNASLMIIENAERLGLAQLHQLRGRVGRGSERSACVLIYGDALSETARRRLQVMRETNDGFRVAEADLELRGPGELLGTRQSGLPEYRVADLGRDLPLLPRVQQAAARLMQESNGDEIAGCIVARWLGAREVYSGV